MSKLNKRIMSAILAFILFMTNIPVVGSADNSTFAITYEGETVKKVEFYNHEKITVTAENIPEGSHQWQIKIPGTEQWVNIHGQTDAEIGLSYAVVGSLLEDDRAYVRCAAISEGLEIAHTATLRVTVKEEPVRQEPVYVAPVIEATEAPAEETEAPIEETEAPVEETEAPIEETEAPVEETEAPVEETEAPVEETEAPVEETEAPVEETEAPVEETEAPVEETEAPVEETEAPIEETEAPVEATETPAEPVAEVPAAPAEEEPAAPVAETEAVIEEAAAPVAETEAATEESEEATEATAEPTEAPKKTTKKSSKKTTTKSVTNQKTESVTPKAAGTDDIELVSVTINYVYWDRHNKQPGDKAWDPTVANVVKGNSYSHTVANKIIPGYKTTWTITVMEDGVEKELANGNKHATDKQAKLIDGNYEGEGEPPAYDPDVHTSSAVKIDLASVNENIVYTVYYQEVEVPYTARYFLQNVYNDLYSENTDLPTAEQHAIMKGYQNTEPDPNEIYIEIPGFTALFHQPDKIAADGSTVFEVYYDRNYYLINFDMDGGYGTAPVYARYKTAFSVSNPTKAGYSFPAADGWELIDWTKKTDADKGTDEEKAAYNAALENYINTAQKNTNGVIKEVPYTNMTYKAQWNKEQVNYTVAYWILDENGKKTYIGNDIRSALPETKIDGDGDLTSSMPICGNEGHVHGDECMSCGHWHTSSCFTGLSAQNEPDATRLAAMQALGKGEPEAGYIYAVDYTVNGRTWYNVHCGDRWNCWHVTLGGSDSMVSGGVLKSTTYTDSNGITYSVRKYHANFSKYGCTHTHTEDCQKTCDADVHVHSGSCYQDVTHLDYVAEATFNAGKDNEFTVKTDKQVEVKGDGSAVVNVYYKYRKYRLKFYYAAADGDQRNTQADDVTYRVVGGSTYYFGGQHDIGNYDNFKNYKTFDLLNRAFTSGVDGYVASTSTPSLKQSVINERIYDTGCDYDETHNRTYYYISFTAHYNDNIASKWPADVFNPITMATGSYNSSFGSTATVSAWNGEHHVWYSRHNGNETIKGVYELLDSKILYDSELYTTYPVSNNSQGTDPLPTVSYLCFWQNGAAISWSIPELYVYNIWLPYTGNSFDTLPANEKKVFDGKNYYLYDSYNVCDDSLVSKQTVPSLTGYTYNEKNKESNWGVIFISNATNPTTNNYRGPGEKDASRVTYNSSTHIARDASGWESVSKELTIVTQTNGNYLLHNADMFDPTDTEDAKLLTQYREAYYRDYFYDANIHKLNFWNRNDWLNSGEGVEGGVAYGASLDKYFNGVTVDGHKYDGANDIVLYPEKYPSGLEPGAYTFDAWYTTAECLEGTNVDLEKMTMPDNDLTVYANWQPITHDTYFYLDYDRYQKRDPSNPTDPNRWYFVADTDHGASMEDLDQGKILPAEYEDAAGNKKDYNFVGWFYLDENGEKVAFNPSEMAVRKELHLYAEWTSAVSKQYTVQYFKGDDTDGTIKIVDADGEVVAVDENGRPVTGTKPVKLADNLNGYAFESTTKTFDAKPKDKLNLLSSLPEEEQNALWLPHTNSHSIVMKSLESDNYFAFIYVRREKAPYWVRYVDAATGLEIEETLEVSDNQDAAVTVQFKYIHGYIPNSFYETLILSANKDENVITFYYTKDDTVDPGEGGSGSGSEDKNARYYIAHYVLNTEGTAFELYTSDSPVAPIDTEISADRLAVSGIEFVPSYELDGKTYTSVEKGIVKSGKDEGENKALILELYYVRQKYSYTVQYFKHGTTTPVKPTETRETIYPLDKVVEESAPSVEGYELSSESKKTLKISSDTTKNVITFYYTPQPLTVNYVAVCPDNRGSDFAVLTNTKEVTNEGSGKIVGSQAIPESGFWFKGWFADEEGNVKIQDSDTLRPQIENHPGEDYAIAKDYGEYTYYALFEPIKLKITQEGMRTEVGTSHLDSCIESGVYEVVNSKGDVVATVIITGNNSVIIEQIPAGTYTVRELTGWTWTYGDKTASQNVTVTASSEVKEVKFGHTANEIDWLHDEATQ